MASIIVDGCDISIVRGSALDQDADAIVNAANTTMRGGGGIDGAIHRAAGHGLMAELIKVAPFGAKTAEAVVTGGHKLKQKWIVHVAGPVWHGGKRDEEALLAKAYRSSFEAASEKGASSISVCSISTGVYRFPLELAAPIALKAAVAFAQNHPDSPLKRILFAMYAEQEYNVFVEALKGE